MYIHYPHWAGKCGGGGGERRKKGIFYLYKPVKVIQTKIRSVSLLLIFFD